MARTALLVVVFALGAATPAQAAVVRTEVDDGRGGYAMVRFEAGPGERNDVTVTRDVGGTYLVRDLGSPPTAAQGCVIVDGNTASCGTPPLIFDRRVVIDAGDLDDVVTFGDGFFAGVQGGEGDDVLRGGAALRSSLTGGPGADTIEGTVGRDWLTGGPGADTLRGGEDNDVLMGDGGELVNGFYLDAGSGDDLLDGGPGMDAAGYGERTTPVAVDLADPAPDGGAGEADLLVGIEGAIGGGAGDVLAGDEGDNAFEGRAGDDTVDGRGGHDQLGGGTGADVLNGGEGDDRLSVGHGDSLFSSPFLGPRFSSGDPGDIARGGPGADAIAGGSAGVVLDAGPGNDRMAFASVDATVLCGDGTDRAGGRLEGQRLDGCERAIVDPFDSVFVAIAPVLRARGQVDVTVSCRQRASSMVVRCLPIVGVRLLRAGGPPIALGSAGASVAEGRSGVARIQPDRRGRRALAVETHPVLEIAVSGLQVFRARGRPPGGGIRGRDRFSGRWTVGLAARGA